MKQNNLEVRELNFDELDAVSGGGRIVEEMQDAVSLVGMAAAWIWYGVSSLGRDPWG